MGKPCVNEPPKLVRSKTLILPVSARQLPASSPIHTVLVIGHFMHSIILGTGVFSIFYQLINMSTLLNFDYLCRVLETNNDV